LFIGHGQLGSSRSCLQCCCRAFLGGFVAQQFLSYLNVLTPFLASAGARSVRFASSLGGMLLTTPTMPLREMIMKFFNGFPYL
jgi:hypothetical protein